MQFYYTSINKSKKESGTIDAESEIHAAKMLRERHLVIVKLTNKKPSGFSINLSKSVSMKEKIIFTRQLAIMIKSGMPVVQALVALSEQTESRVLSEALEKIIQTVKGGAPLSGTLATYPKIFNSTYISVVASGEKSGKLDEVLNNLADQQERDYDLVTKVKSAMIYPMVILVGLIGVMLLIMFFIMPQLGAVFKDFGGTLPASTRFLLAFSDSLRKYFIVYVIIFIILFITFKRWTKHPSGRNAIDQLKLRLPVLGILNKKLYMARFTQTMSMLISAGLPMLEVIKISGDVITNSVYKKSITDLLSGIEGGIPFSEVLKKDKNFPPMLGHMTAIGEQSGNLDYVLSQIAGFYQREVETTTKNLSSMIEPILMVLMGIGVGFIVISVLGPISSITNNM